MLAPNETIQHLQAARNLIADPERWCSGAYGRDAHGIPYYVKNMCGPVTQWCVVGADLVVRGIPLEPNCRVKVHPSLTRAAEELFGGEDMGEAQYSRIEWVNDHLGHATTLRMLDRAIELAVADIGREG